jgi:hypothetical protein
MSRTALWYHCQGCQPKLKKTHKSPDISLKITIPFSAEIPIALAVNPLTKIPVPKFPEKRHFGLKVRLNEFWVPKHLYFCILLKRSLQTNFKIRDAPDIQLFSVPVYGRIPVPDLTCRISRRMPVLKKAGYLANGKIFITFHKFSPKNYNC